MIVQSCAKGLQGNEPNGDTVTSIGNNTFYCSRVLVYSVQLGTHS